MVRLGRDSGVERNAHIPHVTEYRNTYMVVSAKTPHPETPSCPDGADAAHQQAQGRLRGVDVDTYAMRGWVRKPESGEKHA